MQQIIITSQTGKTFLLDLNARRLYKDGDTESYISLAGRPWELLVYLARNPKKVLRKEDLLNTVWGGGRTVEEGVIPTAIRAIRKAVGDDTRDLIETIHGIGYCLRADGQIIESRNGSDLANQQAQTKDDLMALATQIHNERIESLNKNKSITIHNFGRVWDIMLGRTFGLNQPLSDFTVSSDSLHRFEAYEFGRYYKRLMEIYRQEYPASQSCIRILMRCNEFPVNKQHVAHEELTIATCKMFEQAVATVLRSAKERPPSNSSHPGSLYRELATSGYKMPRGGVYQFRLINDHLLGSLNSNLLDEPFNIYGRIARSCSIVPLATVARIPCIEVSFEENDIDDRQRAFDAAWDIADGRIEAFSEPMCSWKLFGYGALMTKWIEVV